MGYFSGKSLPPFPGCNCQLQISIGKAGPGESSLQGDPQSQTGEQQLRQTTRTARCEIQDLQLLTSTDSSRSRGHKSSSSGTGAAFTRAGKFLPNLPGHQWIVAARTLLQPLPVPRQNRSQGKGSSARPNTRWLPQSQANSRAAPCHVPRCPGTLLMLQPHGQALELCGWRSCVALLYGCVPLQGHWQSFTQKNETLAGPVYGAGRGNPLHPSMGSWALAGRVGPEQGE